MKKIIGLLLVLMSGCTDSHEDACNMANRMGFRNCQITNSHGLAPVLYGCHGDGIVAYEISATNSSGQNVHLTACCHVWYESCSLRN
jgi:hypothetical protein